VSPGEREYIAAAGRQAKHYAAAYNARAALERAFVEAWADGVRLRLMCDDSDRWFSIFPRQLTVLEPR
jgi:hypothetical protein